MKKIISIGCLAFLSCGQDVNTGPTLGAPSKDSTTAVVEEINSRPNRDVYIDENVAANIVLSFDGADETVFAEEENGQKYEVKLYEGTLMKASGAPTGFSLRFSPFDLYDYELERNIKSIYSDDLDIILNSEQNKALGFVDYSDETENITWDYFENLFKVYYYEKEGLNYPLKFINEGKTEWDG